MEKIDFNTLREKLKKNNKDSIVVEIPHFPFKIIEGKKYAFHNGCPICVDFSATKENIIEECPLDSIISGKNEFARAYILNKKIFALEDGNGFYDLIANQNPQKRIENLKKSKKDYKQDLYDKIKNLSIATKEDLPIEPTTIYHCNNEIHDYYVNDNGDKTYTLWQKKSGNAYHIITSAELEVIRENMLLLMTQDFSWIIDRVQNEK